MYRVTIKMIPEGWRDSAFPVDPPLGFHLHSFAIAGERIVCMWMRDAMLTALGVLGEEEEAVEWGGSARVGAEAV